MPTIGAGGMGEVYNATDTKLGREVALKILPRDMARDPERLSRFQREARTVAALNHPNIVTIYSVEEAEGVHFLTMELVKGQSLKRCIKERGLPVEQIVEIARALSEALSATHEKGIMHRDLKPANVMVTRDRRVKVLDFGIAKELRAGDPEGPTLTLTSDAHRQEGIVMGTPAYMSPEQIAGRTLDQRTDIFSLGILLHEMATGRRPFEGASSADVARAILRDTPPLVTDVRPELPNDLARIIRRCLERDPRHRVQTARDVSNEFRDLARSVSPSDTGYQSTPDSGSSAASAAIRAEEGFWIAVLPFKHKGANAGLDTLADGITEEITTGFSRVVQQPPVRADCWAMLSWLYREEYTHGFNARPDPLGRALTAARRAVDAAPTNHLAHAALATTFFFLHELGAFRASAERSLALNSMDGLTSAYLGFQIAYSGDWERGCALAERAMQLNPHHPGWYRFPLALNAYRQHDYQRALDLLLKVNMPGFWRTQLMLAVSRALGELAAARSAVQELLTIRSDFPVVWREELGKWWDDELVGHLIDGLRKAGLLIDDCVRETRPTKPATQ
jgi:serine/threonine protein kinase